MIGSQFEALAVDTRRHIYALLIERPRSVGELAKELPISRPAVSQHLKVLVDSGLARSTAVGTRRVYSADPAGVAEFRRWVDQLWSEAIGRFADFATDPEQETEMLGEQMRLEPVIKTVRVGLDPAAAFAAFTTETTSWWPLATHSVGEERAVSVTFEPFEGGRILETTDDGVEHVWGEILNWEEGRRVEFSWYPGLPADQQTTVEVSFRPAPGGTDVVLIHGGWEARGDVAEQVRGNYHSGWDYVLGRYVEFL